MTEKRCPDCKHTKGIGYDFWCGEGHTEYEVFGAKTNCPYYEYHDWSKGTPSRTEKRYGFEMDSKCYMCICDTIDKKLYTDKKQVVDLLNDLHEENEKLKLQLQNISAQRDEFFRGARENANRVGKLKKENEQLKQLMALYFTKEKMRSWKND